MPPANVVLQRITPDPTSAKDAEAAVEEVLAHPDHLPLLVEGLDDPLDIIRAKTAHAMERIADARPELLAGYIPTITRLARSDPVDMVRLHMAMIFGEIPVERRDLDRVIGTLEHLLAEDDSLFVKSRAIVSLTSIGVRVPTRKPGIVDAIWPFREHGSVMLQAKAARAIEVLETGG
jgi:HEAT repeat protein